MHDPLPTCPAAPITVVELAAGSLRSQRGATLVLVAVTMVVTLAIMALGIDLGLAYSSRSEAQRVTDAASLAGASAFVEYHWNDGAVVGEATSRGKRFAGANLVRGVGVDTTTPEFFMASDADGADVWVSRGPELTIEVRPEDQQVRVSVRRADLPTWFARLLGIRSLSVRAMAASEVTPGGTVDTCVLPFAPVDLWDDLDDDVSPANRLPDPSEEWFYEDGAELEPGQEQDPYYSYEHGGVDGTSYGSGFDGTGYGSNFRNGAVGPGSVARDRDRGRRIVLKTAPQGGGGPSGGGSPGGGWEPNGSEAVGPGNFAVWTMPDPEANCQFAREGADFVRENIVGCNACSVSVATDYPTRPGNVNSIKSALNDLYDQDPGAEWVDDPLHPNGGYITGSRFANPEEQSPLVRVIPIAPPTVNVHGDAVPIHFVQFARVFLEPQAPTGTIYGRFMGGVPGRAGGPQGASLIKYLHIVE